MRKLFIFVILFSLFAFTLSGQDKDEQSLQGLIKEFKEDPRGPYKDIKWFCEDGSVREARDPCPDDMEGHQHARYKDVITRLRNQEGLYFGTILTGSDYEDFWSASNDHDQLKQYLINQYLESIDDGWIKRKAQYYRGSVQSEDELVWAKVFFSWVLKNDDRLINNYLLIRQAAKSIPHQEETQTGNRVRILSKVISDDYEPFMALRTKLHSTPEPADIKAVEEFQKNRKVPAKHQENMTSLIAELKEMFKPVNTQDLAVFTKQLPQGDLKNNVEDFIKEFSGEDMDQRFERASELIYRLRSDMSMLPGGSQRLAALDLTIVLEKMIINDLRAQESETIGEISDDLCYLNMAAAGCGYIEDWEYSRSNTFANPSGPAIYMKELDQLVNHHRKIAEWSATNMTVLFREQVDKYLAFEPLAKSFIDDQIRSSILLPYGYHLSILADKKNELENAKNEVFKIAQQERIRGLNPGYAKGVLEVVEQAEEGMTIDKSKIYIFQYPPSDLGPVAGIMTVNEGNMVSHVQLLARNLGIPNAVISEENLKALKKYDGEEVFYAVSPAGNVILKEEGDMSKREEDLFKKGERTVTTITVDTDRIDLERDSVLNMRDLSGKDSGISCGPKAANLAQLKRIFPENVVEGLVIPFGIYKNHMDQEMDSRSMTYWEFINQIFEDKAEMLSQGVDPAEVECIVEGELGLLRENIYRIKLEESFKRDLENHFSSVLGRPMGSIPVFLRSDTNMEDLKEFTGAGLNLTKFNILSPEEIYKGIREVWASPFTERSYKWRQSYLNNPENVYPSILVIPSVNVDYSGVIITKDINAGSEEDMTIAFSRGVGGAVDGQRAETYIVRDQKYYELISPSRETMYRKIPETGGSVVLRSSFSEPILNDQNIRDLIELVEEVKVEIPKNTEMQGPYDIELGFKDDKIWLFQIRPFVENKTALSSDYLQSISTQPQDKVIVDLQKAI